MLPKLLINIYIKKTVPSKREKLNKSIIKKNYIKKLTRCNINISLNAYYK